MLHNMGIIFIVHLVILLAYIIVKVWDYFSRAIERSCMYKVVVFMEFTFLIVGFLVVHMQIFVFSSLTWRNALFTHGYFTFCFLLAIAYILVFALFWIYALIKLMGPSHYFNNPLNYNRFYFFFAGFKDTKFARTFDLWIVFGHFIIGLMIGLLYKEYLAQSIVILIVLIILLVITIIIRPWDSLILNICDIVS